MVGFRTFILFLCCFTGSILSAKRPCLRVRCRSDRDTFSLRAGYGIHNTLKSSTKSSVSALPALASYVKNFAVSKTATVGVSLEGQYTSLSYSVNDISRQGVLNAAGIGFSFNSYARKSAFQQYYLMFNILPISQFTVKSSSQTDVEVQGQTTAVTNTSLLTYEGSGLSLEFNTGRYYSSWPFHSKRLLFTGLSLGVTAHLFRSASEQIAQKVGSGATTLRAPTITSVNYSYISAYTALNFAMDL